MATMTSRAKKLTSTCQPPAFRWDVCSKMLHRVMPAFSGVQLPDAATNEFLTVSNLFRGIHSDPGSLSVNHEEKEDILVRLPLAVAGPGRLAHYACRGDCATMRPGMMYRFRRWIFQNVFGHRLGRRYSRNADPAQIDPSSPPLANNKTIVVFLPVGNSHEGMEDFVDIVPALVERYGAELVRAVDMAALSSQEQLRLTGSAAVVLSNVGGGSFTSLFLPRGGTVLLFYQEALGRWDEDLYASLGGYLHVEWCAIDGGDDSTNNATATAVADVLRRVDRALHRG